MKWWVFFMPFIPLAVARADVDPPAMKAVDLASLACRAPVPRPAPPSAPAATPVRDSGADAPRLVSPDADGVLDVTTAGPVEAPGPGSNPFRVRYHPQVPVRELPLSVQSVLIAARGGEDSVVINGELYSVGDRLEDMPVAAIAAGSIRLRRGSLLLDVPVQDEPTVLRLPR